MSKLILVVDDSISIRKLVGRTLTQAGFEVAEAANGQQGLERLAERAPALVITDLNMPVMDGLDFIRNMREDPRFKFLPVIILTTELEAAKKEEARAAGATGWIVKPFHPEKVMAVVHKVVG